MILSSRERTVGVLTVAVLGILVVDRIALSPLLAKRQQVENDMRTIREDLDRVYELSGKRREMSQTWREMVASGLKTDASEAESQVLQALEAWAREARLSLTMLKQEGTEKHKPYQLITFRVAGTGTMESVSRFLFKVQQAKIPMRIEDMTVVSKKEGTTDELSVTVGISTIFLPPDPKAPGGITTLARVGGTDREASQ